MARPKTKIDLSELEKLRSMQCTDVEIAAFFGVSKKTIERRQKVARFGEIMENAKAKGRISVCRNLFRLANNGNVAAAILLSKNLLGYRDVMSNEHSGPDGGPVQFSVVEALQQRRNRLAEQKKLEAPAIGVCVSDPEKKD
jgi:hypothetical protein